MWCNWVDGACYQGPKTVTVKEANAPASFVFIKGGTTVLTQNSARTVEEMRKKKVGLNLHFNHFLMIFQTDNINVLTCYICKSPPPC